MEIFAAAALIFIFSGISFGVNRIAGSRICPPCAGVFLTGAGFLAAYRWGFTTDPFVPAILMGGSVTGIAYWFEKRLPHGKSPLLWKILFLPAGFAFAYGIIQNEIFPSVVSAVAITCIVFHFFVNFSPGKKSDQKQKVIEGLKEKMKNCC